MRDALTQVAMEGLATFVPGSGDVVNDLTAQDVTMYSRCATHWSV